MNLTTPSGSTDHLRQSGSRIRLRPGQVGLNYDVTYPLPQGPVRVSCRGGEVRVELPAGVEVVDGQ